MGVDEEGLRGSSSSAGQVFEPAGGGSVEMKEEFVCERGCMSAAAPPTVWFRRGFF